MYVTSLPGRIVGAQKIAIGAAKAVTVGDDGLHTRLYADSDGITVTENGSADKTGGFALMAHSELDFSGTVQLYNASQSAVTVYMLTFDTV